MLPPRIHVEAARLNCVMWDSQAGDIYQSMQTIIPPSRVVKVFLHEGKLWTSTGCCLSFYQAESFCYPLIPSLEYSGPEQVKQSHEGEEVRHNSSKFRLGPCHWFTAKDRPVEEWRRRLKRLYANGGMFTAGKTYHEVLLHDQTKSKWNPETLSWVPCSTVVPNCFEAIRLELAGPDFDKWKPATSPSPAQNNLFAPQLTLAL
jgi:hypothetical protein